MEGKGGSLGIPKSRVGKPTHLAIMNDKETVVKLLVGLLQVLVRVESIITKCSYLLRLTSPAFYLRHAHTMLLTCDWLRETYDLTLIKTAFSVTHACSL